MQKGKRKDGKTIHLGLIKALLLPLMASAMIIGFMQGTYAASSSGNTMMSTTSCYTYSAKSATEANRQDYITFGEDITVTSYGSTWSTVKYNGKTCYMLSKYLDYEKMTVSTTSASVNPGAFASTTSRIGYAFYGTEVEVLGTETSSSGVEYIHCIISEVYNSSKTELVGEDVEGYINAKYLEDASTPMVVNGGSNIYSVGYGSSSSASDKTATGFLTTGTEVEILAENSVWAKISYNGEIYYIKPAKLDDVAMQVSIKSAAQKVKPSSSSTTLHYIYWNTDVTILGSYTNSSGVTYYYVDYDGDKGFINASSLGYNTQMEVSSGVKFRTAATTSSSVVSTLAPGSQVTVEYDNGSWARVAYDGTTGYVSSEKLEYPAMTAKGSYYNTAYKLYKGSASGSFIKNTVYLIASNETYNYAYVVSNAGKYYWMSLDSLTDKSSLNQAVYTSVPTVALHTSASSSSASITVPYMTGITLIKAYGASDDGCWYKVSYDGDTYYLWVDTDEELFTSTKSSFSYKGNTQIQQDIIDLAMEICLDWETGYAHGDSTGVADSDGVYWFDCSGFATYVLESVMQEYVPTYNLYASVEELYSTDSIYNEGYFNEFSASDVDLSDLQPGDILFFNLEEEADNDDTAGLGYTHCGIYMGNNEFVHCAYSWNKVCVMPLSGIYSDSLVAVKRFVPDTAEPADEVLYTTSSVNVRAGMGTSYEKLTTLSSGSEVRLQYTDNANWAYVEYADGCYGFVSLKYLSFLNEEKYVYNSSGTTTINIREKKSTSSNIVAKATVGQTVNVLYYDGNWAYVEYADGCYGFISKSYLTTYEDLYIYNPDGGSTVSVYASKSTSKDAIDTISVGTLVTVQYYSGDWAYISYGADSCGYIKSTCLSEEYAEMYVYNCTTAYVREGAGTSYSIVTKLAADTVVTVLGYSGSWAYIEYDTGCYGYIASKYLTDHLVLDLVVVDGVATDLVSGTTYSGITVDGDYMYAGTVTLPATYTQWTYEMVVDYNENSSSGVVSSMSFTSNSGKYEECSNVFKLNEVSLISNRGSVCIPWVKDSWNTGYTVTIPVQIYSHISADYEYLPEGDTFWSFSMDSENGVLNSRIDGATASTTMSTYTNSDGDTEYVSKKLPSSFKLTGAHAVKEIRVYDTAISTGQQEKHYEEAGIDVPDSGINQIVDGLTDLGSSLYYTRTTGEYPVMQESETEAGTYTVEYGNSKIITYTISDYEQPDNGIDNSQYESVHIMNEPETITVGKQYPLTAYPYPFSINGNDDGTADEFDVEWTSSDSSVMSVIDGLLIAKKAGTVEITATLMGTDMSDTVTIEVVEEEEKEDIAWYVPEDYVSADGDSFSDTDYEMTTRAIYAAIDEAAENGYNHIIFPQINFYACPLADEDGYAVKYYVPTNMTIEFPEGSAFYMMDSEIARGDPTKIEIHYFEFGVPNSDYENTCEDSHLIIDTYYGESYTSDYTADDYIEENRFVEFGRKAINCSVEITNAYNPSGYFITADGTCNTNKTTGVMNYGDFVSGWLNEDGELEENGNWISTENFITVPDYGTDGYFISADGQDSYAGKYWGGCSARQYDILWYDADYNLIQQDRFCGRGDYYDIPEDAVYFKVSLQQSSLPTPGSGETEDSPWIAMHDDGSAKMCELKNTNVYNSATGVFSVVGETDGLWIHHCYTNRDGIKYLDERTGDFENGWVQTRHSVVSNCLLTGYFGNPGSYNTFIHTCFLSNYSGFSGETEMLRFINNTCDWLEISEKCQAHIYNNTIYGTGIDRYNTSIGHIYKANNSTGIWVRSY